MTKVCIIAAMTRDNSVIGLNGKLPWARKLASDMENFSNLTKSHFVIMGRKTYESIPKKFRPLGDRENIIVSTTMKSELGCAIARSTLQAIEYAKSIAIGKDIWIIGGHQVYKDALPRADEMHLTLIDSSFEGDVFFPHWTPHEWTHDQVIDKQWPVNTEAGDYYPSTYEVWKRRV